MSKNNLISGLGLALLFLVFTMTFTVSETEKAILLEFKKIVGNDYAPGFTSNCPIGR